MNANELIAQTQDLCRALGRPFPVEIKAYSWDWQRQRYELAWCWGIVKSALKLGRALWSIDQEIHRHYARRQAEKNAEDIEAGKPVPASSAPERERRWDPLGIPHDVPSPASVGGFPNDPDSLRSCAEPWQTHRAPRQLPSPVQEPVSDPEEVRPRHPRRQKKPKQARRKRLDTMTADRQVWLRALFADGKSKATSLVEHLARQRGWLKPDEAISRNSPFQDARKALGIVSIRRGFGRRGRHEWMYLPPAWSKGLNP
jgi:hypothetical protein